MNLSSPWFFCFLEHKLLSAVSLNLLIICSCLKSAMLELQAICCVLPGR